MVVPFYSRNMTRLTLYIEFIVDCHVKAKSNKFIGLSFLSCVVVENSVTRRHSAKQTVTVYLNT